MDKPPCGGMRKDNGRIGKRFARQEIIPGDTDSERIFRGLPQRASNQRIDPI
jgi:hypothetical protein